jgi:cytochrome P450
VTDLSSLADDEAWAGANPLSAAYRDDPYPFLHRLRARSPVNQTPLGAWRLTRWADIAALLKDAPLRMTLADGTSPNFDPEDKRGSFREFMLNRDGVEHARLRRLVAKAFTRRAVEQMRAEIQSATDAAIERALANGRLELIRERALYVPARMICRVMGVPDEDRELFTAWTQARTNAFFARMLPEDVVLEVRAAGGALADYFEGLVARRRENLGDDLLSQLILASEGEDRLSHEELIVHAIGLLTAGFETTIGLIGNGIRAFLEHPEQLALLQREPARIDAAVEECLRYDAPVLMIWRVLADDYEVGGVRLPKDAVIWPVVGAANRDPARFPEPDRFDIARADTSHLSFGGGAHFCLGHQLARLEASIAIGTFFARVRRARIDYDGLAWSASFFRVLGKMPVTIDEA